MISPRQFINRLIEGLDDNKEDDEVGDNVTVVSNGQAYQGKVAEKDPRDPDGKVKVSFGGPRPPKDVFKPDELRTDAKKTGPAGGPVPNPSPSAPPSDTRASRWGTR